MNSSYFSDEDDDDSDSESEEESVQDKFYMKKHSKKNSY